MKLAIHAALLASALSISSLAYAQETAEPPVAAEDEERVLDDVEVTDTRRKARRQPTTGIVQMDARPVRPNGSSKPFSHVDLELFIRPVRRVDGDFYTANKDYGDSFTSVNVELGIDKVNLGSRRALAQDGKRTLRLPEGIYAITEARYEVFNQIGRNIIDDQAFLPDTQIHRFCMSDRALAFEVKDGETTDLGLLLIKSLEVNYRSNKIGHRPIFAASVPIVPVSDPGFRNKSPDQIHGTEIRFDPNEEDLCGSTAKPVAGWFTRQEFAEAYPKITTQQ